MRMPFVLSAGMCLLIHTACIPVLHPRLFLYPVKGPFSDQSPALAITASTSGLTSGFISFQLPSGEACEGPWARVPPGQMTSELSGSWDLLFGQGYYTAHVLGSKWHGKSKILGNRGTEFQLEFYREETKDAPLLGVAKDTAGNVYKVTQS
ncbi:hypothetical protein [Geothrix sp. 21YS21S-4]|uniref:hypothetical protein n=1 Tax=Geothrix sp. 21YS21S-4 TaxID=3068889 RepID=UPI0027BAB3F1|nr:hypothetical protein [Geothrix sp. 21YS21S-4]